MFSLNIHLSVVSCAIVFLAQAAFGSTFVVTTKNDAGAGSLRQAIISANVNPGPDRITFNIGGGAPYDIAVASALPSINDPLVIDGPTQPGYAGQPIVTLTGVSAGVGANGLLIQTLNCEIRGLVIQRFQGNGIRISGGGNHLIAGNFIGTSTAGTAVLGNIVTGIEVNGSANNVIGGSNAADRNIVSGNDTGIYITGLNATNNRVLGNYIGTDITGTIDLGNTNNGVLLYTTTANVLGGSTAGARNVISGNDQSGIYMLDSLTSGNKVSGNYIGTSATGQSGLSNRIDGITLFSAPGNVIGGSAPGEGNVISANRERGIYLLNADAHSNRIEGNYIGLAADGVTALGNRFSGVGFFTAPFNMIGGTNVGARNIISGNQQSGVAVGDAQCIGNVVAGNFIGTDRYGTNAVPNTLHGVVSLGPTNYIGGESASWRNVISGNGQIGVYLQGGIANVVAANYIGTDTSGTRSVRNVQYGVRIDSTGNLIGGNVGHDGNLISGNTTGLFLSGNGASSNVVSGNIIGLNASGVAPLPNFLSGLGISGAPRNTIGGLGPLNRNVISGNTNSGIYLTGAGATGNRLLGNWVGTDATGTNAIGNTAGGIYIYGTPGNFVGGAAPGAGNVVSGNRKVGISIGDAGATGNVLQGNFVGLHANGALPLGNEWHGVELLNGALNTIVGGIASGEGNRIAYALTAGYDGVRIRDGATGNIVRGNNISRNGTPSANGLAIDLGNDGVTLNDLNDPDSGANALQNFPVISAVGRFITTVTGTLNSRPNAPFTLDFYGNTILEPSGFGEAERWLGAIAVTTVGNNASFSATFTNLFGAGSIVAATATDAAGNTSELSLSAPVSSVDSDGDGMPDDYETAAGLPGNSPAGPNTDTDGDGVPDLKEFVAGTNPSNDASALRISTTVIAEGTVITFPSVVGRTYRVEVADDVIGPWFIVEDQMAGTGAMLRAIETQRTDTTRFYRVRVVAD